MKKLFTTLFVSAALLSLTACSGDDEGDDGNGGGGGNGETEAAIGTWKLYGDLIGGVIEPENIEDCDQTVYKFQSSGKLTVTDKYCGEPSDVYPLTWRKTQGNYYEFLAEGQVIEAYYITFSEDGKFAYVHDTPEEISSQDAEIWKKS